MTAPAEPQALPGDVKGLVEEAREGLKQFAYGPGSGMVAKLAEALAQSEADRERLSEAHGTLLEAAYEAVAELGDTDCTAERFLIPAILKADSDREYARAIFPDAAISASSQDVSAPQRKESGEQQIYAKALGSQKGMGSE